MPRKPHKTKKRLAPLPPAFVLYFETGAMPPDVEGACDLFLMEDAELEALRRQYYPEVSNAEKTR
jgi:hypothetical protein